MPLGGEREVRYESRPGAGEGSGQLGLRGRNGRGWGLPGVGPGRPGQERRGRPSYPDPLHPCRVLARATGRMDDAQSTSRHQDSEEQQGYYPPQTVIIINDFSLNYMMCRGGAETETVDEGRDVQRWTRGGGDRPDECGSGSEGVGRKKRKGDGQRQERREDSQRGPEHAAPLVPTK